MKNLSYSWNIKFHSVESEHIRTNIFIFTEYKKYLCPNPTFLSILLHVHGIGLSKIAIVHVAREGSGKFELVSGQRIGFGRRIIRALNRTDNRCVYFATNTVCAFNIFTSPHFIVVKLLKLTNNQITKEHVAWILW